MLSRTPASPLLAIATALALIMSGGVTSTSPLEPDVELTTNTAAFEFNGLDGGLNLAHSSISSVFTGDLTVHVWVQFASLTEGGPPCFGAQGECDMSILDKMSSATANVNADGWRLLKQSDDHFWFCLGGESEVNGCDNGLPTTVRSATKAEAGVWYSVAVVKTSRDISMYVNGVQEATTPLGPFTDTNVADLLVGANAAEGAFLNGRIRQVEIFGRALSGAHIRALFDRSKSAGG
jgi:hypothetical protein